MYHIIVNPSSKSGLAKKQWKELKKVLDRAKITYIVHFTKSEKELMSYTHSVTDKRLYQHNAVANRLIVLGGDGTLNCVLNGIDDPEHTIISYFPTGTSNDFARATKISCDSSGMVSALKKGGVTRQSDVGIVKYGRHSRKFAVSCGIGFDAAVCDGMLHIPVKDVFNKLGLGRLTYLAVALKLLLSLEPVSCDLYLDDKPPIHFHRFLFGTFMQQPYEGGGFMLCPKADATDGLLDVCIASDLTALKAIPLFPRALSGQHVGQKGISIYRARKIKVVLSKPLCLHTDGEVLGKHNVLELTSDSIPMNYRK